MTWAIDQRGLLLAAASPRANRRQRLTAMPPRAPMTVSFESGCVALLPNTGGSAIDACTSCCSARASS